MNSKQTLIASVLAGIGANLCCVAPLVLISLGIGGAWMATLTAFEPVRPVFLGLAFLFIGLTLHKLYLTTPTCEPGKPCADDEVIRAALHFLGRDHPFIGFAGVSMVRPTILLRKNR
jgi:mercuric ion transport protein